MAKVNRNYFDWWSIPHFLAGFFLGRCTNLDLLGFTIVNTGFEVFEHYLKTEYDIFNIPFGAETVYESAENTVTDFFVAEAGYVIGTSLKQPIQPSTNNVIATGLLIAAPVGLYNFKKNL